MHMLQWEGIVLQKVRQQLDSIPNGTGLRAFLSDKVCTTMDKAAGTLMFRCHQHTM